MKIGILGSGNVGQALARGFLNEGHEVWLATRDPDGDKGTKLKADFAGAQVADFATVAREAGLAVLCTPWTAGPDALKLADAENNLKGKVLIDTNNVIKEEGGVLVYGMDREAAAEQIQMWLPETKVVKAFNTVGAAMMYKPQLSATPTMFIAGNDAVAKQEVGDIARGFGWEPLDAGPVKCAREIEAMALVWIRNSMANGANHAFKML
jgi:predicted dinucleotide-binding enzyme